MNHFLKVWVIWGALFLSFHAQADTLVVTSWNIQGGKNLEQVRAEFSNKLAVRSDIVTLQEALTEPGFEQAQNLGLEFGYDVRFSGHDAILSRIPIVKSGFVLSNPKTGRVTPWALVHWKNNDIVIYSPHLSYKVNVSPFIENIREQEMSVLLAHAGVRPAIIAGDLNTVSRIFRKQREASVYLAEARGFEDLLAFVSGGTHRWLGRLDWILARGFERVGAWRGNFAGSDHRWIQAELRLLNLSAKPLGVREPQPVDVHQALLDE